MAKGLFMAGRGIRPVCEKCHGEDWVAIGDSGKPEQTARGRSQNNCFVPHAPVTAHRTVGPAVLTSSQKNNEIHEEPIVEHSNPEPGHSIWVLLIPPVILLVPVIIVAVICWHLVFPLQSTGTPYVYAPAVTAPTHPVELPGDPDWHPTDQSETNVTNTSSQELTHSESLSIEEQKQIRDVILRRNSTARSKLSMAKALLEKNPEAAKRRLIAVTQEFGDTTAGEEASRILQEMP